MKDKKVLSQREKDVVTGIVKGLSNKEIATEMNVSVNTVMTHRRNIASKLTDSLAGRPYNLRNSKQTC